MLLSGSTTLCPRLNYSSSPCVCGGKQPVGSGRGTYAQKGGEKIAKLKPGAVTIDVVTGGVYGDIDHCPKEDLLESAETLLSLLPKVEHRGLWGLHKDFDADCYVYTAARKFELDSKDCALDIDIYRGPGGIKGRWERPFRLKVMPDSERDQYWRSNWYSKLIGSVKDGHVSADVEGIPDLTAERRAEYER